MSMARFAARIAGCLVVLVVVLAAYNFGARIMVQNMISQAKNAPPFPTTRLETSFGDERFEGLGNGYLYKPEHGGSSHRFGDR